MSGHWSEFLEVKMFESTMSSSDNDDVPSEALGLSESGSSLEFLSTVAQLYNPFGGICLRGCYTIESTLGHDTNLPCT